MFKLISIIAHEKINDIDKRVTNYISMLSEVYTYYKKIRREVDELNRGVYLFKSMKDIDSVIINMNKEILKLKENIHELKNPFLFNISDYVVYEDKEYIVSDMKHIYGCENRYTLIRPNEKIVVHEKDVVKKTKE